MGSGVCAFRWWAGWAAGGLVAPGGVEDQFAQELAGGGVDDADLKVLDEQEDAGSGVGSADTDAVEASAVAEGDLAGDVDPVGADSVVAVDAPVPGRCFGSGGAGGGRGGPMRQGPVRPVAVVGVDEGVDQRLQLGQGGRLNPLGLQPLLQGLLEPLDLPAGGRVVGSEFFWSTPRARSS